MTRLLHLMIVWHTVLFAVPAIHAQPLQTGFSFVDEGTYNKINTTTPLNYDNRILPQPTFGQMGTASLSLGYSVFSGSLGFTAVTNNLSKPEYDYRIRELSADISVTDEINLLIGKNILKWGTGYAFNPTGVVEPQRSPSDPSDRLNQNDGRTLLSLTAYHEKSSLTFVYLNDARVVNSTLYWGTNEYAIRANTFLSGFDISLIGYYKQSDRLECGANFSYVIGDQLELHGECLVKTGSSYQYHRIITTDNEKQIFISDPYMTLYDNSKRIFYKALFGGQYTFNNGVNLALEYYHNAEGLSSQEWNRWMNFVKFQDAIQKGTIIVPPEMVEPSRLNLLWSLKTFSPRGTMRDYFFARGFYSTESWSFEAICFMNANDMSTVLVPSVTRRVSENCSLYVRYTAYLGRDGSEFGSLFTTTALNLGIGVQL
ncbi:MAG: hypothetical protein ABSB78_09260 [Bacteroidota bacterium]